MADLVTRLRLDSKQFDDNLTKSKSSLTSFSSVGSSAKGSLTSLLGVIKGYAGPLAAAMSAGEAFNKVMRGSQTTSDTLDATMRACSTSVDMFFTSISTCDFSSFDIGLSNIIEKAFKANTAIDQLGNTVMSYDYFSFKNDALFSDQINTLRDKKSSSEDKDKAKTEANRILTDQKNNTETLKRNSINAIKAIVSEKNQLSEDMFDFNMVERVFHIDVEADSDDVKSKLSAAYEEYEDKLQEIRRNPTSVWKGGKLLSVQDQRNELAKQYSDAILYEEILVKNKDKWLQEIMQMGQKAFSAERSLKSMQRQLIRIMNSDDKSTDPNKPNKTTDNGPEGSIKNLKAKIAELNKAIEIEIDPEKRAKLQIQIDQLDKELKDKIEKTRVIQFKMEHPNDPGFVKKDRTSLASLAGTQPKDALKFNKKSTNPYSKKDIKTNNKYVDSLNAIAQVMGNVTAMTNEGAAAWISWAGNLMSAVASAIPAITALISAKKAEAVTNGVASATQTPLVGWLLAGAAAAAVIGALAAVPAFEGGGIFQSNLTSGDKNFARLNGGEMILNKGQQYNLFKLLDNGGPMGSGGEVQFKIRGQELVGILSNYNKKISKVR